MFEGLSLLLKVEINDNILSFTVNGSCQKMDIDGHVQAEVNVLFSLFCFKGSR